MRFAIAPRSRLARFVTLGVFGAVAALSLGIGGLAASGNGLRDEALWVVLTGCLAGPAVLGVTALFFPRGYRIEGARLVVERTLDEVAVPLDGVDRVEIRPDALRGLWRVAGSGGFGGWFGWFRGGELGTVRVWVTDPARGVVLRGGARAYVVSPADPAAFADAARRARGL